MNRLFKQFNRLIYLVLLSLVSALFSACSPLTGLYLLTTPKPATPAESDLTPTFSASPSPSPETSG